MAFLAGVPVSAGPALVFDAADGSVLYSEDLDTLWHPASLTKMMTAYVTFVAIQEGTLSLDTKIGCSNSPTAKAPPRSGCRWARQITVETALQALIMKSANDVAVMLAEAVSGSHEAFVDFMNGTAGRLGMTRTKFANANGLPDHEQVTTARDMARLATAIVRDFPQYAPMWSLLEMRIGKLHLHTHNGLLTNYAGADGMKTGFICDSGFNVVASATRNGQKLIAVVLGEATDTSAAPVPQTSFSTASRHTDGNRCLVHRPSIACRWTKTPKWWCPNPEKLSHPSAALPAAPSPKPTAVGGPPVSVRSDVRKWGETPEPPM